jgi:uncharacterized repeat protein (TIGR03803 family)
VSSILAAAQHESVIHAFGADGQAPVSSLIVDASGNFYGTTKLGGAGAGGTVFELSPAPHNEWTLTVLHKFAFDENGADPFGSVVQDSQGNLYGTTSAAGNSTCVNGCGTVFELSPPAIKGGDWTFTLLHSLTGGSDGDFPMSGLALDPQGNLFGTTYLGGTGSCLGPLTGCGVVFELSPPAQPGGDWTETILYAFSGGTDGGLPTAPVVFDGKGNLHGTTEAGGRVGCQFNFDIGCGVVFELSPAKDGSWAETVLHSFATGPGHDGFAPGNGALAMDATGALVGTTQAGGNYNLGTVYALRPGTNGKWQYGVLYDFNIDVAGATTAGVIIVNGMLYGTGPEGAFANGAAYQLERLQNGAWKIRGVYSFKGGSDGEFPDAGLLYFNGAFYGTTSQGGGKGCGGFGCGTVYRIGQ